MDVGDEEFAQNNVVANCSGFRIGRRPFLIAHLSSEISNFLATKGFVTFRSNKKFEIALRFSSRRSSIKKICST